MASIAELACGEKSSTQSLCHSLTQLIWCPGNRSFRFAKEKAHQNQKLTVSLAINRPTKISVMIPRWAVYIQARCLIHGDTVVLHAEHQSSDREVADSTPARAQLHNNLRQVVHILVPLSPSSLTTTQPSYLHILISLQPPRCTRTSSVVTLARPPASSSLKITNRSLWHASPHLWNKLPVSLRQHCLNQSSSPSSSLLSPLSSSVTPSLFHSKLKTYLFQKSFLHRHPYPSTGLTSRISGCFCFSLAQWFSFYGCPVRSTL